MLVEARRIECGEMLFQALQDRRAVTPLTTTDPDITLDDAYSVSLQMLKLRQQRNGERVIGKKIGVTSKAVQEMLGVYQPDFGFLTDAMRFDEGAVIPFDETFIAPRAEGEIAFLLKHDLCGPGVDEEAVLAATESISPCFEIVDSRIRDWAIKIEDTVADNASCGAFVLGDASVDPREYDLAALSLKLFKNGAEVAEGQGSAVQGNPLRAVAWLANTLGEFGESLRAGDIVLSGSLVPLVEVQAGDELFLELSGVGSASCSFGSGV